MAPRHDGAGDRGRPERHGPDGYIGYDNSNKNLRSYFFSNEEPDSFGRVALEYVWEVGDDTLTIWGGYVGSPASLKGKFSDDRKTIAGRWGWPGSGYEATVIRAK